MSILWKRLAGSERTWILMLVLLFVGLLGNSPAYANYHRHHHYRHHHHRAYHHSYYSGSRNYGHRRHGYGRSYQSYASAQLKQMQAFQKLREGQERAFLAAFDTNHNGRIDGAEIGPAEKYLREVRLGKILPLPPLNVSHVSSTKRK